MITLLAALLFAAPPSFEPLPAPPGIQVCLKLQGGELPGVKNGRVPYDQATQVFYLGLYDREKGKVGAPLFGSYELRQGILVFKPSHPLAAGKTYRALQPGIKNNHADFTAAPLPPQPAVQVVRIYPSADSVPANLLKFTLYFSGPMRQSREIFDQIELRDSQGKPVEDPWRRTELWSENDTRLTLWFHPGRVKVGVNLREQLGPPLTPFKEYSLVIPREMLDASGNPLGKEHIKRFRATAEVRERLDTRQWKLQLPRAGTREPLRVSFPRAVDPLLFNREVELLGPDGKKVAGASSFGLQEQSWQWTPVGAWPVGKYQLRVGDDTADLAGNTVERPFEVDLSSPADDSPAKNISFQIPP